LILCGVGLPALGRDSGGICGDHRARVKD
jgi:hypothetical protein